MTAISIIHVASLNAFPGSDSPFIDRATLQRGQCLVCNNVLHDRSGFDDAATHTRELCRLRYCERLAGT